MSGLSTGVGLSVANAPFATILDTTTQSIAVANTPQVVTFNTTSISDGISVVISGGNASRITVSQAGKYLIIFSAVANNSAGTAGGVNFWLKKNGTNIDNSNTYVTTVVASLYICASCSFIAEATSSTDYFELWTQGAYTTQSVAALAASGGVPLSPSVILTINKISD